MDTKKTTRVDLTQFEIKDVKGLETGESKGAGCFGEVVEVTVGSVPRVAKRLLNILLEQDVDPKEKQAMQERFCYECLLLSKLDHPNVVEFVGVHFSKVNRADVTLIMERLHIDLEKFLKRPQIPLSIKLSILLDVSSGLLYLHTQLEKPLIHRDLTAGNILLTKDARAKIADLGVSKIVNYHPLSATAQTVCPGAPAYMPPEALQEEPIYSTALDIFSFGHLSLYVSIQIFPQVFDASNDPRLTSAIQAGELQLLKRKKWFEKLSRDYCLNSIITRCLMDRPGYRPKTKQLNTMMKTICVKHPKSFTDVKLAWGDQSELSQQSRALEEQVRVLAKVKEEKEHLEQRVLSQLATIQNLDQELHDTKDRTTKLYSTLEQQKVEASQAKQTLEGEVEAHKTAAATIQDLQGEVESLKEKLERKEARISQKRQEIEHLKKNTSTADATIRKLMIQNSQLAAEKTRLLNDSHMYANTELEQTERERATLLKQVKKQEQTISSMDAKVNQQSQQNRALEEQIRVLAKVKEEKEHLEQRVLGQLATIQNLDQELHDTKDQATELYSTLEEQKVEASQLQKAKQTLEREVEAHIMTAAATIQDLQGEVESLKEKLERKEARISQERQEIEHLKKNTSTADATIRKLMIQNSQLTAEKTRLLNDSHMYANTELEQTEREKATLLKQVKKQEWTIGSMDAKVNQLSQQNRALEEQIRVLAKVKEEKEHLEQQGLGLLATIQNLDQELHDTKDQATELYSTLEEQKVEASQLQKAKQTLGGEVEAHKMTSQAAATIQDLQGEVESLKEKLERTEARISQKHQEIEHLKKDTSTADAAMHKLMIKNSQLEAERTRLINEGHMYRYANTKLEQTEREKAALLKHVEEQERMIGRMDAKANLLSEPRVGHAEK